jgi:hypothetical protein
MVPLGFAAVFIGLKLSWIFIESVGVISFSHENPQIATGYDLRIADEDALSRLKHERKVDSTPTRKDKEAPQELNGTLEF